MALSEGGRNAAVSGLAAVATYVSLHSADPGLTGASEISGGTPAYARKSLTWASAAAGSSGTSGVVLLDVPGATSVSYFGLWSAATGGTYLGGGRLLDVENNPATEAFGGQGVYQLSNITLSIPA